MVVVAAVEDVVAALEDVVAAVEDVVAAVEDVVATLVVVGVVVVVGDDVVANDVVVVMAEIQFIQFMYLYGTFEKPQTLIAEAWVQLLDNKLTNYMHMECLRIIVSQYSVLVKCVFARQLAVGVL